MLRTFSSTLFAIGFLLSLPSLCLAEEAIKDNSFLIEEAYNQERGVVQFINGFQYLDPAQSSLYTFTNEIPITDETHQFSYVIPYASINGTGGASDISGVGDILLNYRYQLMNTANIAMAPRFTLILPTGDYKKELGTGVVGFQFNQAVSLVLSEKWVNHWNAGFTLTPDSKNTTGDKATTFGYNFGTSVIYNHTPDLNFLCEVVMNGIETVGAGGLKTSENTLYVVPGVRAAFDVGQETEVVPGLGVMLGAGPSAVEHETGIFAYLSIESKLW